MFKAFGLVFYPVVSLLWMWFSGTVRILLQVLTLQKSCSGKRITPFLFGKGDLSALAQTDASAVQFYSNCLFLLKCGFITVSTSLGV